MAELGQQGSILVGHDGSQTVWADTFKEDTVFEKPGEWVEEERKRSHAVMTTNQDLLRLLEERHHAFADDEERMQTLQAAVDGAQGRNELMAAQSAMQAELIRQMHAMQALQLAAVNAQVVSNAHAVNEKAQREAQERSWLKNYEQDIPEPNLDKDEGFLDFKRYGY